MRPLGWILLTAFVVLFFLPGFVFFLNRGGLAFLEGAGFQTANRLLFPLLGLYAFFFTWSQVMIGSNRSWLQTLFPWILTFHRRQGIFALLFALLHPLLLINGIGFADYLRDRFVAPEQALFVWFGRVALLLLVITAGSALLMRLSWFRSRWRVIHYANYVIFALVWVHSWVLGTDTQTFALRTLWVFFAVSVGLSLVARLRRALRTLNATSKAATLLKIDTNQSA